MSGTFLCILYQTCLHADLLLPSHSFRNSVFLLFQPAHNDASQSRKSLCNVLFKGGRRVEGNSNALSSLQMSERVMLELER